MTAHIISFPRPDLARPAHEPAAVCREGAIEQSFHYWRGQSGARYLHTVFSLIECPELPKANYILVRRDADDARTVLGIGQTTADASSLNLAGLRLRGAQAGANEIHVHLLAETPDERARVEADLRAARLNWRENGPILAAS